VKKVCVIVMSLTLALCCPAQKKVHWSYFVQKRTDKVFEVHLIALLDSGWSIHAQQQPETNAQVFPTTIRFDVNPHITFTGSPKENGKLLKKKSKLLLYEREVEFVQRLVLKRSVRTTVNGSVAFQLCRKQECLTPDSALFSLRLPS
jgi:hypothetical protein